MSNGTASRITISCTTSARRVARRRSSPAAAPRRRGSHKQLAPRGGNEVIPYIYGRSLFLDIATAVSTAASEDHRVYLLRWDGDKGTELTPGKTLEDYRAQVRAMFWDGIVFQPVPAVKIAQEGLASPWLSESINRLPHGACNIDSKHAQPANRGYTLNTEAVAAIADDVRVSAVGSDLPGSCA
jgi:hypothetical protein